MSSRSDPSPARGIATVAKNHYDRERQVLDFPSNARTHKTPAEPFKPEVGDNRKGTEPWAEMAPMETEAGD